MASLSNKPMLQKEKVRKQQKKTHAVCGSSVYRGLKNWIMKNTRRQLRKFKYSLAATAYSEVHINIV